MVGEDEEHNPDKKSQAAEHGPTDLARHEASRQDIDALQKPHDSYENEQNSQDVPDHFYAQPLNIHKGHFKSAFSLQGAGPGRVQSRGYLIWGPLPIAILP
jgi:hypothetical protein